MRKRVFYLFGDGEVFTIRENGEGEHLISMMLD